jgi:hypothetical protein
MHGWATAAALLPPRIGIGMAGEARSGRIAVETAEEASYIHLVSSAKASGSSSGIAMGILSALLNKSANTWLCVQSLLFVTQNFLCAGPGGLNFGFFLLLFFSFPATIDLVLGNYAHRSLRRG